MSAAALAAAEAAAVAAGASLVLGEPLNAAEEASIAACYAPESVPTCGSSNGDEESTTRRLERARRRRAAARRAAATALHDDAVEAVREGTGREFGSDAAAEAPGAAGGGGGGGGGFGASKSGGGCSKALSARQEWREWGLDEPFLMVNHGFLLDQVMRRSDHTH